jgi:ferredoxin like protein
MNAPDTLPLPKLDVEEKLFQNRYRVDAGRPHIRIVDSLRCATCELKACTVCCPAGCWRTEEGADGKTRIDLVVDGCLECGTCRLVCAADNVEWNYPRGGFGILFKFG